MYHNKPFFTSLWSIVQFHKQYSQYKGFFDEIRKLFIGIALNYNLCKMQPECFATHIQYNFLLE